MCQARTADEESNSGCQKKFNFPHRIGCQAQMSKCVLQTVTHKSQTQHVLSVVSGRNNSCMTYTTPDWYKQRFAYLQQRATTGDLYCSIESSDQLLRNNHNTSKLTLLIVLHSNIAQTDLHQIHLVINHSLSLLSVWLSLSSSPPTYYKLFECIIS